MAIDIKGYLYTGMPKPFPSEYILIRYSIKRNPYYLHLPCPYNVSRIIIRNNGMKVNSVQLKEEKW